MDRAIGPKLPRMLRQAGLVEVRVHPGVHVYPPGHGRRWTLLEFIENVRNRILEKELDRRRRAQRIDRSGEALP
jgi:hypothetical protein